MGISVEVIKELREITSCGIIECKKALEETKGDLQKAQEVLRKRGVELAAKKATREAKEGRIEVYVHPGAKLAVIVEVNCETDFVARSQEFCEFTKELAIHIAATNPQYIKKEDVPEEVLKSQEDPQTFVQQSCLLQQPFAKDPKKTIQDILHTLIASVRENIVVSRFARYCLTR